MGFFVCWLSAVLLLCGVVFLCGIEDLADIRNFHIFDVGLSEDAQGRLLVEREPADDVFRQHGRACQRPGGRLVSFQDHRDGLGDGAVAIPTILQVDEGHTRLPVIDVVDFFNHFGQSVRQDHVGKKISVVGHNKDGR